MESSGLEWYAVIGAALSGFVLGGLWYGPLFGSRWQRLNGLSDEQIASANMPLIFGITFALNLFMATVLGLLLELISGSGVSAWAGAVVGLLFGLSFVVPAFAINYLFARRPLALFGIDAGYMYLHLGLMGAVLGWIGRL